MKTLKVSLAVLVIAAIIFFIIRSFESTSEVDEVQQVKNPFIENIEQKIQQLGQKRDNQLRKDHFNEITYDLNEYHKNGKLGKTQTDNDQWKENLSKSLYSAYANKFLEQAFLVFNGTTWNTDDLNFIRSEYQTIRKSPRLEKGSPVDKQFSEIRDIFTKYDEIMNFIASCKAYSYSETGLSDRFPISEVDTKISRVFKYEMRKFENKYVNNCVRLRSLLKEVPKVLFRAHVRYLDHKINYWSNLYSNYNTQITYRDNLYIPLKEEIQRLVNHNYDVPDFESQYSRLTNKWEADGTNAYHYFNK